MQTGGADGRNALHRYGSLRVFSICCFYFFFYNPNVSLVEGLSFERRWKKDSRMEASSFGFYYCTHCDHNISSLTAWNVDDAKRIISLSILSSPRSGRAIRWVFSRPIKQDFDKVFPHQKGAQCGYREQGRFNCIRY